MIEYIWLILIALFTQSKEFSLQDHYKRVDDWTGPIFVIYTGFLIYHSFHGKNLKSHLFITKDITYRASIGFCHYRKRIDFRSTPWFKPMHSELSVFISHYKKWLKKSFTAVVRAVWGIATFFYFAFLSLYSTLSLLFIIRYLYFICVY